VSGHESAALTNSHKRFDPAYNDARARAQKLGDFNFYTSCESHAPTPLTSDMSQPKFQLETFKSWAGIDSDISYYLNSHHIDVSVPRKL
jgi:D-galacturonate reductase